MWCGGQLRHNTMLAEQAWRRFIDTLVSVNGASATQQSTGGAA
jgi:hypothetical protein